MTFRSNLGVGSALLFLVLPAPALAASISIEAATEGFAGSSLPVRVSGTVASAEAPATVSLLAGRGPEEICATNSFYESLRLNLPSYLLEYVAVGAGPFSLDSKLDLRKVGDTHRLCAYVENGSMPGLNVLAHAQSNVTATNPPPPRVCPAGSPQYLRIAGLREKIPIGHRENFGVKTVGPQERVEEEVEVRMVARNGHGTTFFRGKTSRRGKNLFFIWLDYGDPPARVYANYVMHLGDGTSCRQETSQRVRGKQGKVNVACAKSVLPPVKVVGKVRPNSCVFYGQRGNAFVRNLNWRSWGQRGAKGKGEWCSARLCMPARVELRRPKRGYFSKVKLRATGGPLEGDSAGIRLVTRAIN